MSKIGVSLKIDVTNIDKARLFPGQKGAYLDATVFIDLDQLDQYGNSGMITQDVSKEEKQQGVKGNILGNCKLFWNEAGQAPQAQQSSQQQAQSQQGEQPHQQTGGYIPPQHGQSQSPQQAPPANTNGGGFQSQAEYDSEIPF